jgi:hypothetical protein
LEHLGAGWHHAAVAYDVGLTSAEPPTKPRAELRRPPAVAEALGDAERQLIGYREVLERSGSEPPKPRTHAVACIGWNGWCSD